MKKIILLFFTTLIIFSCKNKPQHLVKIEGRLLPVSTKTASTTAIDAFIQPYKTKVEKEMDSVISYTKKDLVRNDGILESSLGNLTADLCYIRANPIFHSKTGKNIDFALFNFGGIRAGITKGPIKIENAFNLMPFENMLVVAELNSEKITELVQYLIKAKRANPLSKHVNLEFTKDGYSLKINNKPLDKNKTYFVLTSDYLQNGGDSMNFFKNPVNLYKLDYKFRDAIIDYLKETDTVKVNLDGRFRSK